MASISIRFDERALKQGVRVALLAEEGEVRKDVRRRARNVREAARGYARSMMRYPTGRLAGSISFTTVEPRGPDTVAAQVGSNLPYALWVHDGTGVYGPTGAPITPTGGTWLAFEWPRARNRTVFLKEVLGQPSKPFLTRALQAAVD